jgi:hypothetical protein
MEEVYLPDAGPIFPGISLIRQYANRIYELGCFFTLNIAAKRVTLWLT